MVPAIVDLAPKGFMNMIDLSAYVDHDDYHAAHERRLSAPYVIRPDPGNWPPAFMAAFAVIADQIPGADGRCARRLATIREQARREGWPPLLREAEEYCTAPDW